MCSRRALGKFSLNCYPDTRSLHNAGRGAGQVNRNRCSNVSFTEAIFGLGIRDQKWSREVMNLCGFWWSNCSFPETIFGLGIRDQKWFRELWPCPGLKNFSKESLRVMISETIFGLGFRDQKWSREMSSWTTKTRINSSPPETIFGLGFRDQK